MIYEWKCDHCGARGEVTRRLEDCDVPPTTEEAAPWAGLTIGGGAHEWVRVVSVTSTPFEHLRDKGVFDRTHWHRSIDK